MRKFAIFTLIIICIGLVTATVYGASPENQTGLERAIAAQEKHNPRLLADPVVVGTAVGLLDDGTPVIQIFAEKAAGGLPANLDGVPVSIQVTGKLVALAPPEGKGAKPSQPSNTDPWPRPVPIGISTGNANENSAGTIGARVKDSSGLVYSLSNNHVYARQNDAAVGEEVLQPGLYDTGGVYDPKNHLGNLSLWVPLNYDGVTSNEVDAAMALTSVALLRNSTPSNGYGTPKTATVSPVPGMAVQKFGRTTSLTKGTITGVNATVKVGYSKGTALFVKQIIVQSSKPFIKAGDSGSLLVTNPGRNPAGLLFAGDTSGKLAIANDIGLVLNAFSITIDGE